MLLIGVLGSVALVDAANRTSSTTRARESATNLARSVLEAARSLPYALLTQASAAAGVQADPGLADTDPGTAGWQVQRRNITLTITLSVCAVDDPADGIGNDDATFCSIGTPTNPKDPRGLELHFDIFRYTETGYVATRPRQGWLKSAVFGKSFRLTQRDDVRGNPVFTLEVR